MSINGELVRKLRYDIISIKKKLRRLTWSDFKIHILSITYNMLPFLLRKKRKH